MHIATEAPELDLAVNRVQAIVHNVFAREQYMRMREAAERQQVVFLFNFFFEFVVPVQTHRAVNMPIIIIMLQVSIVSGLCKYENDDSGPNSHGLV